MVDKVAGWKNRLRDYIPEEFRKLAQMTGDELTERQNKLLRTLADVLSIDIEKLEQGQGICVPVPKLNAEQQNYLWQTLHELELMEIIGTLRKGTCFSPLIEDFESVEVEVGRYNESAFKPYVRLARTWANGTQHSISLSAY